MPDLTESPWAEIIAFAAADLGPILVVLVAAFLAIRLAGTFVHGVVKTLLDREVTEGTARELSAVEIKKRMDTLDQLGIHVIRFFVVLIAALMIMGRLGVDIGPAVAGLGVVGIAVGFGAQTLVRDYLNGALILIENQYAVGDIVRLAGVAGVVEDFTMRRTTLRDIDGVVHTVPNGQVLVASNMTRVWSRINEDVQVAYDTDIDQATRVIDGIGLEMAQDPAWNRIILEPPKVERVDALGDSGVTLKVLGTVRAPDRWAAAGEFRKRLLAAFASNAIEIPFPHRVIVNRTADAPAAGTGPPEHPVHQPTDPEP